MMHAPLRARLGPPPVPAEPDFPRLSAADAAQLDAEACRRFWASVLEENLAAAGGANATSADRGVMNGAKGAARAWVGSEGFREVAALAGFEPGALLARLSGPRGAAILNELSEGKNVDGWKPSPAQARGTPPKLARLIEQSEALARAGAAEGRAAPLRLAPSALREVRNSGAALPSEAGHGTAIPRRPDRGGREPADTRKPAARPEEDRRPSGSAHAPGLSATLPAGGGGGFRPPAGPPPAGLSPLPDVSAAGVTPRAPGAAPALEWLPVSRLLVSDAYQRRLAERSVTMIRRAAAQFDWARVKAPNVVARPGGWYEVLDGQHTAIILRMVGAARAPCLVFDDDSEAAKAAAFVGLNSSRVQVTPMQKHHAAVASGDAAALIVRRAAAECGATVLRGARNGAYGAGETVAVTALTAIAKRRGEAGLLRVLGSCVSAGLAPIPTDALLATEILLFDPAWAGEIGEAEIAARLGRLDGLRGEAERLRAASPQPRPRALAVTIYRAGAS